mmetsp:Transcript_6202/g.7815  ORF Transcript_6202/g.7815 Transcript_6202/m.7815 type:complete len:351 (+) Transcript_6202:167-1219(+)
MGPRKMSSLEEVKEAILEETEHDGINRALVFVKPHAMNAVGHVREHLVKAGITIVKENVKNGERLGKSIDQHYTSLHKPAMVTRPQDLMVTPEAKKKFKKKFGEDWDTVIDNHRVVNAVDFSDLYNYVKIGKEWDGEETVKTVVAPGAVVAKLKGADDKHDKDHHYIVNGFYLDMRNKFINKNATVHFFECEFKEDTLSWYDFRKNVIGSTNPEKAAKGSLRNEFLIHWKEWGLASRPTYGDNGVHASAGPVEAFRERLLWGEDNADKNPFRESNIRYDPMGKSLIKAGITVEAIRQLLDNVVIEIEGDIKSAFDHTEDVDTTHALRRVRTLTKGPREFTKFVEAAEEVK